MQYITAGNLPKATVATIRSIWEIYRLRPQILYLGTVAALELVGSANHSLTQTV